MKGTRWILAGLVSGLCLQAAPAPARDDLTLFVVPARYSVVQVMMDVLRRRDAALMSYQGEPDAAEPLLHAWNGREWVFVALDDFRTAHFARTRPHRVVLIGEPGIVPSVLAEAASEWAPLVLSIEGTDPASIVNAAGRILRFGRSDWDWFAGRYRMELRDDAAPRRERSWYDEPYVEEEPPEPPWRILRRRFFGARSAPPDPPAPVRRDAPEPPDPDDPPPMPPLPAPPVIRIDDGPAAPEPRIK